MPKNIIIIKISPPNRRTEELITWQGEEARKRILQRLGENVSRQAMHRWLRRGYALRRGGPYIIYPTTVLGTRRFTSREALDRFFTAIRNVKSELEQFGGDLNEWGKNQENKIGVRIEKQKSRQCVSKITPGN